MAYLMREAEHHVHKTKTGRTNHRWKHLRVGDYIPARDWEHRDALAKKASGYAKRHPGWDYHVGPTEDGRIALWRIA